MGIGVGNSVGPAVGVRVAFIRFCIQVGSCPGSKESVTFAVKLKAAFGSGKPVY
jgi:cytosine/uracil/thiamine/allantoin permease